MRFEGGVVGSVTGDTITLSLARQAINPVTRAIAFDDHLSADHTGRTLLLLTGDQASESFRIASNTTDDSDEVTCTGVDFSDVSAGDIVVICDRFKPDSAECHRNIDELMASFSAHVNTNVGDSERGWFNSRAWVCWRCKVGRGATSTGWFDLGWFPLNAAPKDPTNSVNGKDALRYCTLTAHEGSYKPDQIKVHERVTNTVGQRCVVLKMIDESDAPGNPDDGLFRFFDSPEATDALVLANHTTNWASLPPPMIYTSADNNDTITGDDELLVLGQAATLYPGLGELQIAAEQWNDIVDAGRDYVKVRYERLAMGPDQLRGVATGVSTTTVTDTNLTGALALPTTGIGLTGIRLRATSGDARGQSFTVASNTATAITLTADIEAAGFAVGDAYELYNINEPRRIIEDLLRAYGYQFTEADLPLYVATLDEILIDGACDEVAFYDASLTSYTDLTAAVKDETSTSNLAVAAGDMVYFRGSAAWDRQGFRFGTTVGITAFVKEYWNGSAYTALPSYGLVDPTALLTTDGTMAWNRPADWRPTNINGGSDGFVWRLRITGVTGSPALQLKRVTLRGRPSAPPPAEAPWVWSELDDDRRLQQYVDSLREYGLIPPNWILRADPSGAIQGQTAVQGIAADWSLWDIINLRQDDDDSSLRTGVLGKGISYDIANVATEAAGASIALTSELSAKITAGSVAVGTSSDRATHGLAGIIGDNYYRDADTIPGAPAGPQYLYRYGFTTSESSTDQRALDDLPLWTVDLGQAYTDLSEVEVFIDNRVHPYQRNAEVFDGEGPWFGLEVSSDGSTWLPLCTPAVGQQIEQRADRWYAFSDGDALWQKAWRYLRMKCVVGGKVRQGVTPAIIRESGQVVTLRVRRSGELQETVWLGEDEPFTAQKYQDILRAYGRRLHIFPRPDPTANTSAQVREVALSTLRELASLFPSYSIDGVRPDADLFQTIAVTAPESSLDGTLLLITELALRMSKERATEVSLGVGDFTIAP